MSTKLIEDTVPAAAAAETRVGARPVDAPLVPGRDADVTARPAGGKTYEELIIERWRAAVNFGGPETVPARYAERKLYAHNPQITLMRTTPEENALMGEWIARRLNACEGPVVFLLPEGGVSALDAPGMAFHDPEADQALFAALEAHWRPGPRRRLVRLPHHINDPAFADRAVAEFLSLLQEA